MPAPQQLSTQLTSGSHSTLKALESWWRVRRTAACRRTHSVAIRADVTASTHAFPMCVSTVPYIVASLLALTRRWPAWRWSRPASCAPAQRAGGPPSPPPGSRAPLSRRCCYHPPGWWAPCRKAAWTQKKKVVNRRSPTNGPFAAAAALLALLHSQHDDAPCVLRVKLVPDVGAEQQVGLLDVRPLLAAVVRHVPAPATQSTQRQAKKHVARCAPGAGRTARRSGRAARRGGVKFQPTRAAIQPPPNRRLHTTGPATQSAGCPSRTVCACRALSSLVSSAPGRGPC